MQITFDTNTITDDEVRGIFALLDTVCPKAFDPGPFDASEVKKAVEEKLADKGWVAGPSETVATFDPTVIATADDIEQPAPHLAPNTDANGLQWDERIHSGTKALNADGTWRTKRGVDKALVASVGAELRSQGETVESADARYFYHPESESFFTGTDDSPLSNGETVELSKADWEERQKVTIAPPAPPAPPAPTAPLAPAVTESAPVAPTPSAPSSSTSPFVALMKRVTTAQGAGKLTAQRVKELLESLKKKSIMDLRTDTDALDAFAMLLDGEGV